MILQSKRTCATSLVALLLLLSSLASFAAKNSKQADESQSAIQLPLRVSCGGPGVGKPGSSDYWQPDKPFVVDGDKYVFTARISTKGVKNAAPEKVYQTVRRDSPEWHFKSLPDGFYLVRLHFSDANEKSNRRMNFWFQGVKLIGNYSPNKAAGGSFRASVKEVIVSVSGGDGLKIRGSKGSGDDCFIAGLEILAAPKGAAPTPALEDSSQRPKDLGARIRKFTGSATRIVWSRLRDPHDIFGISPTAQLYALDTEDGGAERLVLPEQGSYARPMLTPDGAHIIFSSLAKKRCYIVNFDGSGLHEFAPGFASSLWFDRETKTSWACVREKEKDGRYVINRRNISKPDDAKVVWTTSDDDSNDLSHFNIMPDGFHAVDCNPWPNVGTIDLARERYHTEANGCWPSVSPADDGRFFIFRGNHRSVWMFDSLKAKERRVSLDTVPEAPAPTVYHPRWTNHPRFITITSPLGHRESRLFLGKWNDDYSGIEDWQRITWADHPDAFGNAWIANSPANNTPPRKLIAQEKDDPAPQQKRGLVFIWENQRADNAITDEHGKTIRLCRATMHGHTRPSSTQGADIREGSLDADDESAKAVATQIAKSGAMTLSFVTQTGDAMQNGVVATYGSPAKIVVVQNDGKLEAKFISGQTSSSITLGEIAAGKPQHWTLSYDTGKADLKSLQPGLLRFGRNADGNSPWRGSIEQIEIYDRMLSPEEIAQRQASLKREWAQRKTAPRIVVEAELIEASKTEEPEHIRPYLRALSENLYRVRKVVSGELKAEKFIALQWSILDQQKLKTERKPGDVVTLTFEPEDEHPELSGEHRTTDLLEPDLPLLYDIGS